MVVKALVYFPYTKLAAAYSHTAHEGKMNRKDRRQRNKKCKRYSYFGGIQIDCKTEESVSTDNKRKPLTKKERGLLKRMCKCNGKRKG